MSNQLLLRLEEKINNALDIIEVQRLQLEEAEQSLNTLKMENSELRNRQVQWEQSLSDLLKKLSTAELSNLPSNTGKSLAGYKSQQLSQTVVRSEDWDQDDRNFDDVMNAEMDDEMGEAVA